MDIRVLSRLDVEQGVLMGWQDKTRGIKIAIISITDPGSRPASIFRNPWPEMPVLRLEFHDVEGNQEDQEGIRMGVYRPMTTMQATKVVDFVKDLEVDILVVHCEAGISRSAGTAAACAVILGQSDAEFFEYPFNPNRHCYRLVLEAAGLSNRCNEEPA